MCNTDYAVAPGEYLQEWRDDRGLSQKEVAELLGLNVSHVDGLVCGYAPVTADIAARLERVVGIPTQTWLRYEATYQEDLERMDT